MSPQPERQLEPSASTPQFRLDLPLHQLLYQRPAPEQPNRPASREQGQSLPEPVFPQHPELFREPAEDHRPHIPPERRQWTVKQHLRTVRGWMVPYLRSRLLPGDFHPITAYLFLEYKCNLDCHYCWSFDNSVRGMTEDVARRSIDWLHDVGCRVVGLMGGEPLLRPDFAHKVTYYAAKKNFWIYLGTNGRLLRPEVTDRLFDAGLAVVNFALDAVDEKPGLPKALAPVRRNLNYLLNKQYRCGQLVFFNMNICRTNLEDMKQLTEFAHDNGLVVDFHINETPMLEQGHFQHYDNNSTYIQPEDWPRVDDLIDWIIDKKRQGYRVVNSVQRLNEMKDFMRGRVEPWSCRAGQNNVIIRVDGSLAPCFPMYSATYDWGTVGNHRFDVHQLNDMKESCQTHCFSTLNHNLSYCYNDRRVIRWLLKQARNGFGAGADTFE
jgi:MoaA/NifB/PqqE/SkfB family radical SAM enzyme